MSKKTFFSWSEHFRVAKKVNKSMFARAFMLLITYNDMFVNDFRAIATDCYTADWHKGLMSTVVYMLDYIFAQLLFNFDMVDQNWAKKLTTITRLAEESSNCRMRLY